MEEFEEYHAENLRKRKELNKKYYNAIKSFINEHLKVAAKTDMYAGAEDTIISVLEYYKVGFHKDIPFNPEIKYDKVFMQLSLDLQDAKEEAFYSNLENEAWNIRQVRGTLMGCLRKEGLTDYYQNSVIDRFDWNATRKRAKNGLRY